jgi:hypothetical protein
VADDRQNRIARLQSTRRRKLGIESLQSKLKHAQLDGLILPDDIHLWAIERLRSPEPPFSIREDLHFSTIREAISRLRKLIGFRLFDRCCLFLNPIDDQPAVIVQTKDVISALERDPFFLSPDASIWTMTVSMLRMMVQISRFLASFNERT